MRKNKFLVYIFSLFQNLQNTFTGGWSNRDKIILIGAPLDILQKRSNRDKMNKLPKGLLSVFSLVFTNKNIIYKANFHNSSEIH